MHSSKLVQVLKILSINEFKDLKKFLKKSTVDGNQTGRNSYALFQAIQKYYPGFKSEKLKKEILALRVFPDKKFKSGRLEKQMSNLFALIQEFILEKYYRDKRELYGYLALSDFYKNRQLFNLVEINIRKYQKALDENKEETADYYYDDFLLKKETAEFQLRLPNLKKEINLSVALESLDQYYLAEKLELACVLLANNKFRNPVELGTGVEVIKALEPLIKEGYFDTPIVNVYYSAYRFLNANKEEEDQEYLAFEKMLEDNHNIISDIMHKTLSALSRNFCILKYHKGNTDYLKKSFQLSQKHLKAGYLYHEDKLFPTTMSNIVISGLRLKEYDWVYQFIKDHEHKITRTTSPEVVYNLNLANYYFHTAKFEQALDCLEDTYESPYFKLSAKRLELKIYFETKHVLLPSKIDAFKIYIYRFNDKQVVEKQKIGNRNFIDLLKQIQHPSTFQNEKRIIKLIEKVNVLEHVAEKEWLIEKLEKLR